MRAVSCVFLSLALLAGCATQYQKQGLTGGFDETQLTPNVLRVSFKGNGYTSPERAADLALLRCAEMTLQSGFSYFAIVDAKEGVRQETFTTPTYTTPSQSYTTLSATGNTSGNTTYISGQAQTTTYGPVTHGGQTYTFSKPSATNTIVMVKTQNEFPGMTYDAKFLYESLGRKYEINKK